MHTDTLPVLGDVPQTKQTRANWQEDRIKIVDSTAHHSLSTTGPGEATKETHFAASCPKDSRFTQPHANSTAPRQILLSWAWEVASGGRAAARIPQRQIAIAFPGKVAFADLQHLDIETPMLPLSLISWRGDDLSAHPALRSAVYGSTAVTRGRLPRLLPAVCFSAVR